ncbi:MAG TPA: GAF domain-containing protein [Terriglobales bacterium]|nr:GAF domain-containing protein [Terriglobales bacterium]
MEPLEPRFAGVDRSLKPLFRERRRAVRQKVHTPAYVTLTSGGISAPDLCEVLDISEQGVAIQTAFLGNRNRILDLSLDLSETRSRIRTKGHVVWSDYSGRLGIHFSELGEAAQKMLREWLFLNAMVAAANHASRAPEEELLTSAPEPEAGKRLRARPAEFQMADYTTTLTALAAVQREVESLGLDLKAALGLIAERTRALTRANGAAIAFSDRGEMFCLASAGSAPPVGTKLERGIGFSGLCLDTGLLQRCHDTETDPRVDQANCRLLGIRSMIAAPVRMGNSVVGLLEVFSSEAHAFHERDSAILQRLVETILAAVNRAALFKPSPPPMETPESDPPFTITLDYPFSSALEELPGGDVGVPRRELILLILAALLIAGVLAYLLVPWAQDAWRAFRHSASPPPPAQSLPASAQATNPAPQPESLDQIRARALAGDPFEQFSLGTRYATGEDVPLDYAVAAHWFLQAAEQGHVLAQDTLGAYYWMGRGVPKDVNKAYYWSVVAREGDSEASGIRVAFLTSRLTPGEVSAIQAAASKFLQQHPPIPTSAPAR